MSRLDGWVTKKAGPKRGRSSSRQEVRRAGKSRDPKALDEEKRKLRSCGYPRMVRFQRPTLRSSVFEASISVYSRLARSNCLNW